jgi:hypothetical protein
MKKSTKTLIFTTSAILVFGSIFLYSKDKAIAPVDTNLIPSAPVPVTLPVAIPEPIVPEVPPRVEGSYHTITLGTSKHGAQLTEAVGQEHLAEVLSLNRIDIRHLQNNQVIVVPDVWSDDPLAFSSFPRSIPELSSVPKMMFVAQREQEFGAYEYGVLVRSGGISTGKKATPTTSKLFYANWKGKEVISTSNDEWILKWNVNIANQDGIGIHEYELPGYPASHSCIRFSADDAKWFYDWADTWILSPEEKLLAQGTPVLVFGQYGFGKTAPWKKLPEDKNAMTITLESMQERINPLLEDIKIKQDQRVAVLGSKI